MLNLLADRWITTKAKPRLKVQIRGVTGSEIMAGKSTLVRHLSETDSDDEDVELTPLDHMMITGIVDWDRKAVAIKGEPVKTKTQLVKSLGYRHYTELAAEIEAMSELGEEQEKNSGSRSKSRRTARTSTARPAPTGDTATKPTPPQSPSSS